jgi:glycosyltransferase involved in cell wall biosynthesis
MSNTDKTSILVDLKAAFDGFAGIPQETRLLFSALRSLGGVDARGLIQHGGRRLRPALKPGREPTNEARRIFQLSKFIVSLSERPYSGVIDAFGDNVDRLLALKFLQLRVALGLSVPHSVFDSRLFGDFIWRTFFDKTLNASEKSAIAEDDYYVIQSPRNHFHKVGLKSMRVRTAPRYPLLDTRGFDYFLAQTPFPGRVTPGTQMIVRYHDAVPVLMPHTINDKAFHQATHFQALRSNIESGALFSCVSEATRQDLLTLFPQVERQAFVIHNMVSQEYYEDPAAPRSLVARLVTNRLADIPEFKKASGADPVVVADDFQYLLMVSTVEPRKNHLALVSAWERLKYSSHPDLKLVVVGGLGWDQSAVLKAFKPWAQKGDLYYLQNVPSPELRVLYRHAAATVCPSLAEGFDYSGIEAMRCGSPVISSDIAVHREIYQDASVYFNPYSVEEAAHVIGELVSAGASDRREQLVSRGREISSRYLPRNILPQWEHFFAERRRGPARGGRVLMKPVNSEGA